MTTIQLVVALQMHLRSEYFSQSGAVYQLEKPKRDLIWNIMPLILSKLNIKMASPPSYDSHLLERLNALKKSSITLDATK